MRTVILNRIIDMLFSLKTSLTELDNEITEANKRFKEACALGDLSENAAYSEVLNTMEVLTERKLTLLNIIEKLEAINLSTLINNYVEKDYIDINGYVKLKNNDTNEISEYVILDDISLFSIGILSSKTKVFLLLKDKKKGDTISLKDNITKIEHKYTILDVK